MIVRSFILLLLLQATTWASPWVVAHRGGAALGPENRLGTFEKAVSLGVDAIELDIHQSLDGELMVIHDVTLDRTFGRSGRVDGLTAAALHEAGVPTLQRVIDGIAGHSRLIVEIKHPRNGRHRGIERRLVDLLRKEDLVAETVVISFDRTSLRRLHELEPALSTGFLYHSPPGDLGRLKKELGISYLGPVFPLVTSALVEEAHAAGLKVNPWTVNEPAAMKVLIAAGVDAITTDRPNVLLEILGRRVPAAK